MVGVTTHRPVPLSAVLAVLAAALAVGLIATAVAQRVALLVGLVGAVGLGCGPELRHRGHGLLGGIVGLVGAGLVAAGVGLAVVRAAQFTHIVELVPGLLGVGLVALALGPLWPGRERAVFSVGTALVMVGILVSGVVYESDARTLLLAGLLTVLAWDLAEQAVNLGEQVGREARSYPVQAVHGGATVAVGAVAVVFTRGVTAVNVTGLSLLALAGLLAAAFTLAVTLYN